MYSRDAMSKEYFIYIMTDKKHGTLYIGSTSSIASRVDIHKSGVMTKSFTAKYGLTMLVYIEQCETAESMVNRERTLKSWNRNWKLRLIMDQNPKWDDLAYLIV